MATGHPTQATSLYDERVLEEITEEVEAALTHLEVARNRLARLACTHELKQSIASVVSLYVAVRQLAAEGSTSTTA